MLMLHLQPALDCATMGLRFDKDHCPPQVVAIEPLGRVAQACSRLHLARMSGVDDSGFPIVLQEGMKLKKLSPGFDFEGGGRGRMPCTLTLTRARPVPRFRMHASGYRIQHHRVPCIER